MTASTSSAPAPGWIGGFEGDNPKFAYPDPDLTSLPMLGNMDNIPLLTRQQAVKWPEFSWETDPGNPDSRAFQMFAPDISRIGYNDRGRVYSIICPQQGTCGSFGCLNVEVTVTGQRGWVNETTREMAADLQVEGKIWFSPSTWEKPWYNYAVAQFKAAGLRFPLDKANAIRVATHKVDDDQQPVFGLRRGLSPRYDTPDFTKHPEAWDFAHIDVQIGDMVLLTNSVVDEFNALVLELFNLSSGNLLTSGNVLSWNVWFTPPGLVDQVEWADHVEKWRHSIDADHGSPDGPGTDAKFRDGTKFSASTAEIHKLEKEIEQYIKDHL